MKSSARNIKLSSVDDLTSGEQQRIDDQRERVMDIPLSQLHPFKDHPFKVVDDEKMEDTVESIRKNGIMQPAIARPDGEGSYELISGHRRFRASQILGNETLPVIVRDLDDDAAVIYMVDTNLQQRETLLPSERAFAYKMKLEAMKHQGERYDLTCGQVDHKLTSQRSRDILAEQTGESSKNVQRYIHLTALIEPLLNMVDERKIAFNPAYELSFLTKDEQQMLMDAMEYTQATPSLSQAQRLKKCSQEGLLTEDYMKGVMSEEKKSEWGRVTLTSDDLHKYFPKSYTPQRMQETIIKLLEQWHRAQQREGSR